MRNTAEIRFSIAYFGDYPADFTSDKYRVLFESACFADENNFEALWIPERHFHSFGGFSPNPAVIAAALSRETKNIQLRAGSVVLPLHHPIRVAEDWSVIDNFSAGRVGIAFASGWHPDDFILAETPFSTRRETTFTNIELVRKLWRGEKVSFANGAENQVTISIHPRALQKELPVWIAALGSYETYAKAGELGVGILTNLIGQTLEQLSVGISIYHDSLIKHGHSIETSKVTLLLHTFLDEDAVSAQEIAKKPFSEYIQSSLNLFQKIHGKNEDSVLTPEDNEYLFEKAYKRYIETSALIGNIDTSIPIIEKLHSIGVTEIACFIDFGIEKDSVLQKLTYINDLKNYFSKSNKLLEMTFSNNKLESKTSFNEQIVGNEDDQFSLWMISQMRSEGSLAYNLRTTLKVTGQLDLSILQGAIDYLSSRHEALRTVFSEDGLQQVIQSTLKIKVNNIVFSHLSKEVQAIALQEWFQQEGNIVFDLRHGPLWRVNVLKLSGNESLLVITIHHIICDGISKGIILEELGKIYTSLLENQEISLPACVQNKDFIKMKKSQLSDKDINLHETFWKEQFADNIPVLNFPTDKPYPVLRNYKGRREKYELSSSLWKKIGQSSLEMRCTPFMFMLSAWAMFLHKICNQTEIIVGVPAGDRSFINNAAMVGYGFNLLPILSKYDEKTTVSQFVNQVKGQLLKSFDHHEYPFSRLLKLFNSHDWSRAPLVASTFNMDKLPIPKFEGLKIAYEPQPANYVRFDLSFNLNETSDNIFMYWEFNTDIFLESTINKFQEHFMTLLEAMCNEPAKRVIDLSLISEQDTHPLCPQENSSNDLRSDKARGVVEIFEEFARIQPNAMCVHDEQISLNYAEVDALANSLAEKIILINPPVNGVIGINTYNNCYMLIALLGILKARCAFVGFSEEIPIERRQEIAQETNMLAIVSQSNLSFLENDALSIPIIFADTLDPVTNLKKINPLEWDLSTIAYIVYTSGSTGTPKGIVVQHQHLANYLTALNERLLFKPQANYLFVSPLHVDLGYTVLFSSLYFGGCLHIVSRETSRNSEMFIDYCEKNPIDYLKITPNHFTALSYNNDLSRLCPREAIIFGGEILQRNMAREARAYCQVFNHYGPAETTIGVVTYKVDFNDQSKQEYIPIGKPLQGVTSYILDRWGRPVPPGIRGELCIGGSTVTQGYLNRPDLSELQFIISTFDNEKKERLYKTGDLACLRSDGNIELFGRIDDQIKVRGYRVEPDEISTTIIKHPSISQAVVIAHKNPEVKLVAYVVAKNVSDNDLTEFLKKKLPAFMIPQQIIFLESLPLLPSGKVNKKALEELTYSAVSGHQNSSSTNEEESQMLHLWKEILETSQIGMKDDFFDLGGHSLHAIRLCTRVLEAYKVSISISILFDHSTPESLLNFIKQNEHSAKVFEAA